MKAVLICSAITLAAAGGGLGLASGAGDSGGRIACGVLR